MDHSLLVLVVKTMVIRDAGHLQQRNKNFSLLGVAQQLLTNEKDLIIFFALKRHFLRYAYKVKTRNDIKEREWLIDWLIVYYYYCERQITFHSHLFSSKTDSGSIKLDILIFGRHVRKVFISHLECPIPGNFILRAYLVIIYFKKSIK